VPVKSGEKRSLAVDLADYFLKFLQVAWLSRQPAAPALRGRDPIPVQSVLRSTVLANADLCSHASTHPVLQAGKTKPANPMVAEMLEIPSSGSILRFQYPAALKLKLPTLH
jgi:hypothetical protein